MDLTQPCYDSILNIDKRLEDLQKEVALMEKEYGFKEKHVNLVVTNKLTKPKTTLEKTLQDKNRYNNLRSVKSEEDNNIKKQKIVPKISQKWKDIFRKKPDKSYFLEKNKIGSFGMENDDFKPRTNFQTDDNFFEEFMNDYGLNAVKNKNIMT